MARSLRSLLLAMALAIFLVGGDPTFPVFLYGQLRFAQRLPCRDRHDHIAALGQLRRRTVGAGFRYEPPPDEKHLRDVEQFPSPKPVMTDSGRFVAVTDSAGVLNSAPDRQVLVAYEPEWFNVTAWQGGGSVVDPLEKVDQAVYRTTKPIPVYGGWKSTLRIQQGDVLISMPLFMPKDEAIPAADRYREQQPADAPGDSLPAARRAARSRPRARARRSSTFTRPIPARSPRTRLGIRQIQERLDAGNRGHRRRHPGGWWRRSRAVRSGSGERPPAPASSRGRLDRVRNRRTRRSAGVPPSRRSAPRCPLTAPTRASSAKPAAKTSSSRTHQPM